MTDQVPYEDLRQMLTLADFVKFAKGDPSPEDNQRSLDQAYTFVKKTIRKEIVASDQKE